MPSFTYQIGMDFFKVIPSLGEFPYPLERVWIYETSWKGIWQLFSKALKKFMYTWVSCLYLQPRTHPRIPVGYSTIPTTTTISTWVSNWCFKCTTFKTKVLIQTAPLCPKVVPPSQEEMTLPLLLLRPKTLMSLTSFFYRHQIWGH